MNELTIELERVTCCTCGVVFGIEKQHRRNLLNSGGAFCCPSGHYQRYTEDQVKKLEEKVAAMRRRIEKLQAITKEVCPDCGQYFKDLDKHKRRRHGHK